MKPQFHPSRWWVLGPIIVIVAFPFQSFGGTQHQSGNDITEFRSDACTAFPDGNYSECGIRHDLAYWKGGTFLDKTVADNQLRACVSSRVNERFPLLGYVYGALMQLGVSIGGHAEWGYGWKYDRGYASLSTLSEDESLRLAAAEARIPEDFSDIETGDIDIQRDIYPSATGNYCIDEVDRYLSQYERAVGDVVAIVRAEEHKILDQALAYRFQIESDSFRSSPGDPLTALFSTHSFVNCQPHHRDDETSFFVGFVEVPGHCSSLRTWVEDQKTITPETTTLMNARIEGRSPRSDGVNETLQAVTAGEPE